MQKCVTDAPEQHGICRTSHRLDDYSTKPFFLGESVGIEPTGEGIFGRRSHNANFFERIEHSGSR